MPIKTDPSAAKIEKIANYALFKWHFRTIPLHSKIDKEEERRSTPGHLLYNIATFYSSLPRHCATFEEIRDSFEPSKETIPRQFAQNKPHIRSKYHDSKAKIVNIINITSSF